MRSRFRKTQALVFALLVLTAATTFAQQQINSTLTLKIVDRNENLIPKFSARLKKDRKIEREIVSESEPEVVFAKIAAGGYVLEIEAEGFKPQAAEIELKPGRNDLTLALDVADIVENVNVEQSAQEKATENGFSNFLTDAQIAALPEDPREMEAALKRMAGGDNVVIRVDGFSAGGRLPSKAQIASIRIVRSSYDAENHELGVIFVDVVTKVGSRRWDGSASLTFADESLNARNAFAPRRFPEQNRNAFLFLSGPIRENKTDFSLLLNDSRDSRAQNIVAFLPTGAFGDSVESRSRSTFLDLNVNHNLTAKLPGKFRYSFSDLDSENLGVGGFNLPERAFSLRTRAHEFRFSTAGNFAGRFLDEFRFQYLNEISQTVPQSDAPAIIVLDSFSRGGAGNLLKNSRQSFRAANNLLFGAGRHALKIGGEASFEKQAQASALNLGGTFIFSNLRDFQNAAPSIFSQSAGERRAAAAQIQTDVFFQDDVRIGKSFILSFGVRYEWQNNLRDFNNFSPRVAFSWSPGAEGRTTFRGGVGIFYNRLDANTLLAVSSRDETQPGETIIFNPGFPNPTAGGAVQILPPSFLRKARDLRLPEILHASFGAQRRILNSSQIRAEYVFQKGTHQFRSRDVNAPLTATGWRPNPGFGRIAQIESSAFFVRHALNLGYSGSLTRKISLMLDYTLARTISDSGGIFSLPADNYDLRAERGAADNDQRHRLSGFLSWQIRKGLRVNAIYTARSPLPYTITTGRDDNRDTNFNDRPPGFERNGERGAWRSQFDLGASYIFSFATRKSGNSGKSFSVVMTAAESSAGFDATDPEKRFSLKFFANVENLFNRTNPTNFVGVETSPFFRQPTAAGQARKISLGVRFNF